MPSMSVMLEGLVTTLLSLDFLLHHSGGGTTQQQPQHSATSDVLVFHKTRPRTSSSTRNSIPARCRSRSRSLSSSSSNSTTTTTSSSSSESSSSSWLDLDFFFDAKNTTTTTTMTPTYDYHCPPIHASTSTSTDDQHTNSFYDDNDTVFGQILRGELPAVTLAESNQLVALQDIRPRAPLHALIIPKRFVASIVDFTTHDLPQLKDMHDMALQLIQRHYPDAYTRHDYRLCFHIPPFTSVPHLHLHVLAPLSQMTWYYRYIKYLPHTRWCTSLEAVVQRLSRGDTSVPYTITTSSATTTSARKQPPQPMASTEEESSSSSDNNNNNNNNDSHHHPSVRVGGEL